MKKFAGDIIILHTCTKNHNHMMCGSWDMECDRQNFFVILDHFLPFYPPMDLENQNFEKMKKTLKDITILQMLTINDSHMIYGSSNMECNRQNFLSFWTIFCPFPPLTNQKIKIWKTETTPWRYHHFTQVYQKSRSYAILFLRYGM